MIEFIKKYTTYPVEDNPKMAAFIAVIAGYVTGQFGLVPAAFKLVVAMIS